MSTAAVPTLANFARSAVAAVLALLLGFAAAAGAATAPVTVMPLGDSLTLGAYAAGNDGVGGYRAPLWNQLVAHNYTVDFVGSVNGPAPAGVDANHEGHGGWRIDDIANSIDGWLAATHPQVVLLLIGANDIIQGYTVDVAQARMNTLLDKVIADEPNATLLVATLPAVPQPNFYNYDLAKLQDFNSRLPAMVNTRAGQGKHIALVDMYAQSGINSGDFNADNVHPNDAGYAKMAGVWYNALSPLLVATPTAALPAQAGTFYRALNLGGDATAIDGHAWEAGTAANFSSNGSSFANQAVVLTPATDAARTAMIRSSIYSFSGLSATMSNVPTAVYDVYLYVWEDNNSETVTFTVNGLQTMAGYVTGAAGHWDRLDPWSTTVTGGTISFGATGGVANISGVEVWRTGDAPAPPAPTTAPIALHPQNPHYFVFRGQPTVLVTSGEHYGAVINPDFDYVRYLNRIQGLGFNLTRVFACYAETWGEGWNTLNPAAGRYLLPWARSATAGFSDGGNKFDLSRFDDAYWSRLKAVVQAASDRGIVVELSLFGTIYGDSEWSMQAFNPGNNINGLGGGGAGDLWDTGNAAAMAIEDAYVRKAARELNGFDNVYVELCNEPYFGSFPGRAWHERTAAIFADEESHLANRHLVAHNISNGTAAVGTPVAGVSIFNFHYASPPDAVAVNYALGKAISFDENGFRGTGADPYRHEAWQFLLAGGAIYDGLDWTFEVGHEDGSGTGLTGLNSVHDPALWPPLKALKEFMLGLDLVNLHPDNSVIVGGVPGGATARALVKAGAQVAVHIDGGSQANLVLNLPAGSWRAQWVDTRTGAVASSEDFTHAGGNRTCVSPTYDQDIALRVVIIAAASTPPAVAAPASGPTTPVTGTTAPLTVLGGPAGSEAGLTYTWSVVSAPVGGAATFTPNGSNAAQHAIIAFNRAGTWTVQVSIANPANGTATISGPLTIAVAATFTSIVVTGPATVAAGGIAQFTAQGRDQFGQALTTQPALMWTAAGGTVNGSGSFTAPAVAGSGQVTASSGGKTGHAAITVTAAGGGSSGGSGSGGATSGSGASNGHGCGVGGGLPVLVLGLLLIRFWWARAG